jgi:hypothetical protein
VAIVEDGMVDAVRSVDLVQRLRDQKARTP